MLHYPFKAVSFDLLLLLTGGHGTASLPVMVFGDLWYSRYCFQQGHVTYICQKKAYMYLTGITLCWEINWMRVTKPSPAAIKYMHDVHLI